MTANVLNITQRPEPRQMERSVQEVERCMEQVVRSASDGPLGEIVLEHLRTGGKRIRARLALAAVAALGVPMDDGIGLAAACEMLHNATLIHDDLQDGDRVRRGKPATWVAHGFEQAINAGDLLLMLPSLALEHTRTSETIRWRISRTMNRLSCFTACGQSFEQSLQNRRKGVSWDEYTRAAEGKTGAFFSLPVEGAALVAGFTPHQARQLGETVAPLGLLFQIQDDVLDLYGDKGRAKRGNDIREGKLSALVATHLELHPEDERRLLEVLHTPRDQTTDEQVSTIAHLFALQGALEEVANRAQRLFEELNRSAVLHEVPGLRTFVLKVARDLFEPMRMAAEQPILPAVVNG